ncbi:MAG: 50S ribosomal protein L10, partial [Nanopusillaceae archaeon]
MVSQQKILYVKDLYDTISKYDMITIVNVMDVPTSSLQQIRKKLKSQGFYLKVVRKNLLIKALERLAENDKNIEKLINELENAKRVTILLMLPKENINPFIINKILEENKSYRSAKAGDVLEEDIVIKAGPTNLTPGPVLTELKKYNIKTKVEGGKIVIVEDTVVAKKGQVVDEGLASLLQKFNLTPIPVKVKLLFVYDRKSKILYTADILSTPLEVYLGQIKEGFRRSLVLSLKLGYPTKENIKLLLRNTYQNTIKLSLKSGIVSKDNIKLLLSRTYLYAKLLK